MNDNNLELTSRLKSKIRTASDGIKSINTATYPTPAMKLPIALLVAAVAPVFVHAQVFYSADFQGTVGSEWSNTTTSTTPIGARKFLGEFGLGNNTVSLGLSGLPAHTDVTFAFDLFAIRTWDGNGVGPGDEDRFRVSLGNGVTQSEVLNTTFSNHTSQLQAYPDSLASGLTHAPRTGAAESDTLGYSFNAIPIIDTVYHFSFTLPHSDTSFNAVFLGTLNQGLTDESWGLDNVTVSVSAVPEPSEYAAVAGLGLVGFALWRRRAARA